MKSHATRAFWKHFDALPRDIREQAKKAFRLWQQDASHPSLHFKQIHTREQIFAVRVSRGHRALGLRDGNTVTWFRLGLNVGWQFNKNHSIDVLLDHISNAKLCDTNEGLENVGIRYGYKF